METSKRSSRTAKLGAWGVILALLAALGISLASAGTASATKSQPSAKQCYEQLYLYERPTTENKYVKYVRIKGEWVLYTQPGGYPPIWSTQTEDVLTGDITLPGGAVVPAQGTVGGLPYRYQKSGETRPGSSESSGWVTTPPDGDGWILVKEKNGKPVPCPQPPDEVTYGEWEGEPDCDNPVVTQTRTKTVIMYVLADDGITWIPGEPVVTTEEGETLSLTEEELKACEPEPNPSGYFVSFCDHLLLVNDGDVDLVFSISRGGKGGDVEVPAGQSVETSAFWGSDNSLTVKAYHGGQEVFSGVAKKPTQCESPEPFTPEAVVTLACVEGSQDYAVATFVHNAPEGSDVILMANGTPVGVGDEVAEDAEFSWSIVGNDEGPWAVDSSEVTVVCVPPPPPPPPPDELEETSSQTWKCGDEWVVTTHTQTATPYKWDGSDWVLDPANAVSDLLVVKSPPSAEQLASCVTQVTPGNVVFRNPTCSSGGSYTIPATPGVVYRHNGVVRAAGTYPATGTVTIVAEATAGYVLDKATSWTHTFSAAPSAESCKPLPATGASEVATIAGIVGMAAVFFGGLLTAVARRRSPA